MSRAFVSLVSLALLATACNRPSDAATTKPPHEHGAEETSAPQLDPDQLAKDIQTLADDGWAGRFTKDLEHLGAAADYIAASHKAAGIKPVGSSYRVEFEYPNGKEPGDAYYLWIVRGSDTLQIPQADVPPAAFGPRRAVVGTPVWVAADSTRGVEGRAVLTPAPSTDVHGRVQALASAGASAVLFVTESLPDPIAKPPTDSIGAAWVTTATATASLNLPGGEAPKEAIDLEGIKISMARSEKEVHSTAPNVVAWIEGSERPDEIVLLGAHYDHIGTKEFGTFCRGPENDTDPDDVICNGADDNASGTALLMNIARAMGESGYRPKRSLVFAHFAGEELGLHGSRGLAESPPAAAPFNSGHVVAMLNMDMVGRLAEDGVEVGGEKTSTAWPGLIAAATPKDLEIKHPASVTGRSDHAHWFRQGIPVLFFFTGLHADYHRTSDEFETLNLDGIAEIGELVLGITLALAEGAEIPATPKK
ncbi:MAG: M20/M25/M40 family metallo-hydrolase [Nannocystales bacterium]